MTPDAASRPQKAPAFRRLKKQRRRVSINKSIIYVKSHKDHTIKKVMRIRKKYLHYSTHACILLKVTSRVAMTICLSIKKFLKDIKKLLTQTYKNVIIIWSCSREHLSTNHICGGIAQLARASGSYPEGRRFDPYSRYHLWALSSAGRASALQAGGHRFEPYSAHHFN